MKTLSRSLILAGLFGLVVTSRAQNLSLSYTIQLLPGENLIANQLMTGRNTLAELFPKVPEGAIFRKFNNTTKQFEQRIFELGEWIPDDMMTLLPGEGAFLSNPTREPFTLNRQGDSLQGTVVPVTLLPGISCVSRMTFGPATYEDIVGKPPSPGTILSRWDPSKQQYITYNFASGQWNPTAPVLNVGEAAFIEVPRVVVPPVVEIDEFPSSLAQFTLVNPNGASETIVLVGPTVVEVAIGSKGEAADTDGDGLDQVSTRMTKLELRGSSSQGLVVVRLRADRPSVGEIEETANTTKSILDIPPFATSGRAVSFFDVWTEIVIGQQVLVPAQPLRMESVITHKPPAPGEAYQGVSLQPLPLLDATGKPTGIQLSREIHIPNPPRETDQFAATKAEITLQLPSGATETVFLSGPTVVVVDVPPDGAAADVDGDGRDQVAAEMTSLDLKGDSSLGPVQVRLDPQQRSRGEIEETRNSMPGVLDVPPFTNTGTADSFFDVFFEITLGDQRLHAARAARMQSVIQHKPPGPGDTYVNPFTEPIELLDANGNPTGVRLLREVHVPNPPRPEIDVFPESAAVVDLQLADGTVHTLTLKGPTTVHVFFDGAEGQTHDSDGDGLDDVATEMVQLQLTGPSPLGPVIMRLAQPRLDPALPASFRSVGMIEETANTRAGRLDLPPFAETGSAWSFFDVFFEVEVGGRVYHARTPKRMRSYITRKPPQGGTAYFDPVVIELFDQNGQPTGIKVLRVTHIPSGPPPEIDHFPNSEAVVDIALPTGQVATVQLRGPTTVQVWVGANGEADDSDGDGLDDVDTEMVQLDLKGESSLGGVSLRLADPNRHLAQRSVGGIEETSNSQRGRLDLPPFSDSGQATSFFDVFFEVEVGGRVYHSHKPKRMVTTITHKPPQPGATYEFPEVIDLFDANEQPSGIRVLKASHTPTPTPTPEVEIDRFPESFAHFTVALPDGQERDLLLVGPTTVNVFFEGGAGQAADNDRNGRDEVATEMVQLDLKGTDAVLGDVNLRLRAASKHPGKRSLGQIEELANTQAGRLDLSPFAPAGLADSFFDVFFEIDVPKLGVVLHNDEPKRMRTVIDHKPPGQGSTYEDPQIIELLNEQEQRTGIRVLRAAHTPNPPPPEIDHFPHSVGQFTVALPDGRTKSLTLAGPTTVQVFVGSNGEAADSNGNGRDDVATLMTQLELAGRDPELGVVRLRLRSPDRHPGQATTGQIEEQVNAQAGRLDVPPFAPAGRADSFFDIFFEVEIPSQNLVLHNVKPKRMRTVISHKPPGPGETYEDPEVIELFNEQNQPTGIRILRAGHTPNPEPEIDEFPFSRAQVTLQLPTGQTERISLSGPARVVVDIPPDGTAADTDGDGLDQVRTEMVKLELNGVSSQGPVVLRQDPARRSWGEIEERANNTPGKLDVPPFTPSGTANSFFDVWFQVQVGTQVLFGARPVHMQTVITHKPPGDDDAYISPEEPIDLLDAGGRPTGLKLVHARHEPRTPEIDIFEVSTAQITLQLPNGQNENVALSGPTVVLVDIAPNGAAADTDGDGREQVATEMTQLDLRGTSSAGPVRVTLNPARRTLGEIEERANTTVGKLDVPPFTASGTADSFFDVWFQVELPGQVLIGARQVRMTSVITHKPPGPGDQYISAADPIELLDANGRPSGIRIIHAVHVPTPPEIEVDQFPNSTAIVDLMLPDGTSHTVTLSGPTTVHVLFEGGVGRADDDDADGLDEVGTEMVQLDLKGNSPLGPVAMRLADPRRHPTFRSIGSIEETANTQAGRLDLPPFAPTGTAWSFFDVFVEVEVGGRVYHAHTAKRMRSYISHKPPEGGTAYFDPVVIELFDQNEQPTGIKVLRTTHIPSGPPPEIDHFPNSNAVVDLMLADGTTQTVNLSGPTTIQVWVGPNGESDDSNANGLDDVDTEMVQLQLAGTSPLGQVIMRLADPSRHPALRSLGMIEETANTRAARLDLPPFAETGTAWSFFDVFVEVEVGGRVYHAHNPKRMRSYISHKPPEGGTAYFDPVVIELFDQNDQPTGIKVLRTTHIPSGPPPEIDHFPNSNAVVDLMLPDGTAHTVNLSGPTTIQVWVGPNGQSNDSNGNGLDDVDTEMVHLQLAGTSPLGPVIMRLADPNRHPTFRSVGSIEETANTQAGRLDLPPFAPTGAAWSFFDVFIEVEVGGRVYHAHTPKRMRSYISHKPPEGGTAYFDPVVIELFDQAEQPTGIKVLRTTHIPSGPPPEIDHFPNSNAVVDLMLPDGTTHTVNLSGPTTVQVWVGPNGQSNDSNGNGLDDVDTEMVQLQLAGTSPLGPVVMRLADPSRHPALRSVGMIEETANTQAGRLDLPPFAPTGTAWSFFDVFVEVEVGGRVYHAHTAKRMRSYISHKPPEGGTAYFDPVVIELFDQAEQPTGIKVLRTTHIPSGPPPEIDHFPNSSAVVDLMLADGTTHTVNLSGPTTIQVWVGPNGQSNDSNGNGLDDVDTEMVQLQLTGTSPLGPVVMRLADPSRHPAFRSTGMIEETANTQAGRLDLPPFAETGTASSFFEVFFEVEVGGRVYHAHQPKRMRATIRHKPPGAGTVYEFPEVIELFDERDQPTGIRVLRATHVPVPALCQVAIRCPVDIVVTTGDPTGAVVTYAPIVDGNCPPFRVVCEPPSGAKFPVGTTTVTCRVTDAQGNTAACTFKVTVRILEIDVFKESVGQFTLEVPGLGLRDVVVTGPTTVHVQVGTKGEASDSDGNGRDDVPTEMVELELTGTHPELGAIKVRLRDPSRNPNQRSVGRIEELANTQAGRLDVPPFAPTGLAESVFDIFFEIEVTGRIFHNIRPKRMYTVIDHKPPGPGTIYEYPEVIELFDEQNLPTGVRLVRAGHTPNPPAPEIDHFEASVARFTVELPGLGQREIVLSGPSTIHVWVGSNGEADDSDGDGRDDVVAQMVQLDLSGVDPDLGDIKLRLRPATRSPGQLSRGLIEETTNAQAGRLDLPPFAPSGTADSFFDVFFEVEIPRLGLLLHNVEPKRMRTTIRHKPPGIGEIYEDPQVIELFNEQNQPAGVRILKATHTPRPPEIDDFPISVARVTLLFPDGRSEVLHLVGPTRVEVAIPPDGAAADSDSDGLDQVATEMTRLDLRGHSSLGPVRVGLNPAQRSIGEIEEQVNTTRAHLDLPPFAPSGQANSFFDVWFRVEAGNQVLTATRPVRMRSVITHKPPGNDDLYLSAIAQSIELLDANGRATGFRLVHAGHQPNPPPEIDEFAFSRAQVTLRLPNGQSENVVLRGPTRVVVQIPPAGNAADTDGDGLEQVNTEMVALDLQGSSSQGPVHVTLNPARRSLGEIEEIANATPGILDVPPFTAIGRANSFFDVWFRVGVGTQTLFAARPARMQSVITHKPPGDDTEYISPAEPIDLLDAAGNRTGIQLIHAAHRPSPPKEIDEFYFSRAQITLQLPSGASHNVVLTGPTTVEVDIPPSGAATDTDGDGREQVATEMVSLNLVGVSPLGPVRVGLNPTQRSRGEIEEQANNTAGRLDLPPFTAAGRADSFFDVWFEVEVGGQFFRAARPARMTSVLTSKPPGTDTQYVSPTEPIELLDLNGKATGLRLIHAQHQPTRPEEIDQFRLSTAQITLEFGDATGAAGPTQVRSENIRLVGPATVRVDIPPTGEAIDLDGDGRDQVATRMVQLDLKGTSSFGLVRVSLRPDRPSTGEIEERANSTAGKLDLPPFTTTGTAESFFDVWFQVEVAGRVFHTAQPTRMQTVITRKPPGPLDAYFSPVQAIELLDRNGMPVGVRLVHATHVPSPPRFDTVRPNPNGRGIELAVPTVPSVRYIIEYKDDLSDPQWQVLVSRTGDGSSFTVSDPGTLPHRFIRVRVQSP